MSLFKKYPGFIPGLSNFSIQYNYNCASIATAIMLSDNDKTGKNIEPDFEQPEWAATILLAVAFIGSVVGMITMGYLGDIMGCDRALVIANLLIVGGALASALASWGDPATVWATIAWSRFFLGVGVGGCYPLSAAKAAKQASKNDAGDAVERTARAFFWQGPGSVAPYVLACLLLRLPHTDSITSIQFRILLGVGALPALVVLLSVIAEVREDKESDVPQKNGKELKTIETQDEIETESSTPSTSARGGCSPHWWTVLGTGGAWFLFDIAYYGTIIFAPHILKEIFGANQSLTQIAFCSALMASIGTFGNCIGLCLLSRIGAKVLNSVGFVLSTILFIAFAVTYWASGDQHIILFGQLCLVYVTLYAGPNIATFVLPVTAFPADVRSTFHGVSAASAKIGAMVGTLLFPIVDRYVGVSGVMLLQALFCALGACLNHFCINTNDDRQLLGQDSDCSGTTVYGASDDGIEEELS